MGDVYLIYPTIFHEMSDESGRYFSVDSPNIDGMVTDGRTRAEAAMNAVDAIATMLDGEKFPAPQDPSNWQLAENESVVYVTVNMSQWQREKAQYQIAQRKVRVNITIPEHLRDEARAKRINISKLTTEVLEKVLGEDVISDSAAKEELYLERSRVMDEVGRRNDEPSERSDHK